MRIFAFYIIAMLFIGQHLVIQSQLLTNDKDVLAKMKFKIQILKDINSRLEKNQAKPYQLPPKVKLFQKISIARYHKKKEEHKKSKNWMRDMWLYSVSKLMDRNLLKMMKVKNLL